MKTILFALAIVTSLLVGVGLGSYSAPSQAAAGARGTITIRIHGPAGAVKQTIIAHTPAMLAYDTPTDTWVYDLQAP